MVDDTLGRALTAAEQAQITGTLGANHAIQFNLPAEPQTITLIVAGERPTACVISL